MGIDIAIQILFSFVGIYHYIKHFYVGRHFGNYGVCSIKIFILFDLFRGWAPVNTFNLFLIKCI